MKKILSILLTISILFSCINFNVFAEMSGALSVSAPTSAVPGETINVTVSVPSDTNALSGSFNLIYDNTMLEVVSCTSGTILSDRNVTVNEAYSDTKIRMSFDGDEPLSKGGIILNATFNVLPGASGTVKFEVEKFKLYDENYEAIEISETVSDLMHIVNDADTEVSVSCAENVNTGENLTVTVDISNALNVCGGSFNLVYDADKFTLTSATAGSVLSGFSRQLNKTYATNKVRLTWAGSSVMTENGTLLTVVFTAKDGVLGNADFTLEKLSVSDVNGTAIESIAKSGSTNVVCTHNVMEWTVTEEPTCTEIGTETYSCGCGHSTDTREVAATGHVEMEWVITKEATCDNTGVKEYTCKACGYVDGSEEIPAHGHIYESIITHPTQAEQGYTTHTCTGCGHSYKDTYTEATGYTISYDVNGGKNAPESQNKKSGESITLSDIIPTRTGYTFLGWATDKNAENAQYYAGNTYSADADLTLYALWDAHEHTITYVVDGETVSVQTYDYEALINALAEPTKEGYTFSGWDEIPITMPDEDITISGSFTINSYIVSFDANGGENAPEELTDVYNSSVTIPGVIPTKEGFTFVGWATSNKAKKAEYNVGDSITLTKDVNLYAVWVGIWSGNASEKFSGGNGTKTNPYIIKTAEELKLIANKVNSGDTAYASACYIMVNDIALNDISNVNNWATEAPANEWTPIGNPTYPFTGTFDGNGYTISGLYINQCQEDESGYHKGLFGFVTGGTISNLGIEKGYLKAYRYSGALVGGTYGVTIRNCYNKIPVTGDVNVAGIVGAVNTQESEFAIENCYNEGIIDSQNYSGGLIGEIRADKAVNISNCYNKGNVSGSNNIGGIVGAGSKIQSRIYINNCYNLGNIAGAETHIGGIVGHSSYVTVNNSYNGGTISSTYTTWTHIGGIGGWCEYSEFDYCYNYGDIVSSGRDDGAICGALGNDSIVSHCYNVGTVKGNQCGGGIVAVASSGAVVKNCFNAGKVETVSRAAGIAPWMEGGSAINCINIGTIITGADKPIGAITTNNKGTVTDCYYLDTCGAAGTGTGLTFDQIQSCANYSFLATESVGTWKNHWTMGHNPYGVYPVPKGMTNLMEIPIEFDLNGGNFDEYELCSSIIASNSNTGRGVDHLIIFNNSNTGTGTNIHGCEVIVDNRNIVIDTKERIGNNVVPNGGFILSGHGMMHEWIHANIDVGDKVYYDANTLEIKVYKKNPKFTFAYGKTPYLPTPYKEGYVFKGWYDESDNLVYYGSVIYRPDTLQLEAKWEKPSEVYRTTYNGNTYILFDNATSWESAKEYCDQIGGHLATITSAEENTAITELMSNGSLSYYFIGAEDLKTEGTFQWITGEVFSYTNWTSGEPNDSNHIEDSVQLRKAGTWNDIRRCYTINSGFICEIDDFIPVGATIYNGHYYELFNNNVSWTYAKEYCESIGGHLVTITNEEEKNAVYSLIKQYNDSVHFPYIWFGASDIESEGNWNWVTGEEWNFVDWDSGQPDNYDGVEHYLHYYSSWNKWNDAREQSNYFGFVCEIDSISPVAEAEFNGHKYMVFDTSTNWTNAQAYCESLGGYLATLTSTEEEAFVAALCANNSTHSGYYIGATDSENEGTWQWVTGEKWDYTNWCNGEPNNASSVEHYLEIWNCSTAPAWNDIPDKYYDNLGFICEISVFDSTLTYDANGGENAPEVFECKTDTDITLSSKVPTRPGYIFKGWSETTDGEVKYQPSQTIRISTSTTLYAVWEELCIVAFDANGGENAPETIECNKNTDIIFSSKIPTRPGCIFKGWSETKDGEVKYHPSDTIKIEKSTTLYAVWEEKNYTITFDANGGRRAPSSQTKAYRVDLNLTERIPTRAGYTFVGWSTNSNVSEEIEYLVMDGIPYKDFIEYLPGQEVYEDRNMTLYAVWVDNEIAPNTITYYHDGKIYYIQAYNEYAQILGDVAWLGWSTYENAGDVEYYTHSDYYGFEDLVLYSVGEITGVAIPSIYFDANGGENGPYVQVHNLGEPFILTTEIPTKKDCDFVGWATSADATEPEYLPGEEYTYDEELYLYAIWKKVVYNITYVTAKEDDFSEWGEWQTQPIKDSSTTNVGKQYRYRDKIYTTADTKTLDGWTYYKTTSSSGTWSEWTKERPSPVNRDIQTKYIPPVTATQFRYGRWTNGLKTSPCPQCGEARYGGNWYIQCSEWVSDNVSMNTNSSVYCMNSAHTQIYPYSIEENKAKWYSYTVNDQRYYWEESRIVESPGYYLYRYRDIEYTYHFYKFGEWSDWQNSPVTETSERDVEIRYRQRSINADNTFTEAYYNETATITDRILTHDKYYFVGWSTEYGNSDNMYIGGDEITLEDDIVLYAVWKEGGTGTIDETVSWRVDDGTLMIEGSGTIGNFSQGTAPWYKHKDVITAIRISSDITSVGDYAFYGLDKVTTANLGGVKSIGDYSFSNCTSLSSIDINKISSIGSYAFRYCTSLSDIEIKSAITYGVNVYANCSNIKTVNINDGVSEIKAGLLDNCGTIDVLNISGTVTQISENAFADCGFTSVVYSGTKDEFAKLLTSENVLDFDSVTCESDNKTYLYSDFFAVSVNITDIAFEKKSVGMFIGESVHMLATVTPSNATEKLVWSSDDETVATVDNAGNVTAISEGVANITALSESGNVKAICVVYVNDVVDENAPVITVETIEEIKNGDTFDVNISLKNNPGITSMRLNLAYDNSVMELTNVTDLGLIGGSLHSEDYTSNDYVLYWDNGTSKTNFTQNGDIVTLTFKVKDNTKSGDYPLVISYNTQDIINCELVPVSFDIVNGYVTVKAFTYGDVNSDESVDTMDSAYLSRHIARWSGITINSDAADVNKDKKVNVLDSAILKRHIANWTDYRTLPYSEPISLLSATALNEAIKPTIVVSNAKGQCGKTVDITISIKDNPGIVSMRLDVEYDKDAMTLTKVTDTGLLPGAVHGNELLDMPYCLYWDNGSSNTDYTVNGNLVTLTFLLKENVDENSYPITISYNYDEPDIINTLLKPVNIDIDNGQISVIEVTEPQIALSNAVIGEKTNYTLHLLSPDTISGVVFIATYDKNTSQLRTLEKYDAIPQKDFSVNTKNGETVKIMWWDSLGNLKPIADSVIVSEE